FAAMTPLSPARNSSPPANRPIQLQWLPPQLPAGVHVAYYRLEIGTGYILDLNVTVTQSLLTLPAPAPHTSVRWLVSAFGVIDATSDPVKVGAFEEPASFTVGGSPMSR